MTHHVVKIQLKDSVLHPCCLLEEGTVENWTICNRSKQDNLLVSSLGGIGGELARLRLFCSQLPTGALTELEEERYIGPASLVKQEGRSSSMSKGRVKRQ